MNAAVIGALGVIAGSFAALWWAEASERRRLERDRARWRSSRRRAHAGLCSFSGRAGVTHPECDWLVECPRCEEVFVSVAGDVVLPDHEDNRTR